MQHNTYQELIKVVKQRPKMPSNDYWLLIVDNANLIFWESQDHSKTQVAQDLGLRQPEFSLIYKVVCALASKGK